MSPKAKIPEQQNLIKKKYQPPKEIKPEHQDFLSNIGLRLHALRKSKKISSAKLAKQVGISRNGYHLIETGRIYFNISTILQVLSYYKESPSDFFKNDEAGYFTKK